MYKAQPSKISSSAIPILLVPASFDLEKKADPFIKKAVASQNFKACQHQTCFIYDAMGELNKILIGVSEPFSLWDLSHLPLKLPAKDFYIKEDFCRGILNLQTKKALALGWGFGFYSYDTFKTKKNNKLAMPRLLLDKMLTSSDLTCELDALFLARDLINMPPNLLGPAALEKQVKNLAHQFKAKFKTITGNALLKKNFPLIYAVGKAAEEAPRLLELEWGNKKNPSITLVGKGVCFDTGGLDLKPSSNMKLMKKDMGGAAQTIALASMIMQAKLPIHLKLLIPAVENAIGSRAYRPQDVLSSRIGLSIEIGNTDAEGRLVLADALTLASEDRPELIIDFATLTGAGRGALGLDVAALFSNNAELTQKIQKFSSLFEDPLWPLPLWQGYKDQLKSTIADLNNISNQPYGGAITAALFLQHFVDEKVDWLHIDLMAWNIEARPGRPIGGEVIGVRALFHYLKETYRG